MYIYLDCRPTFVWNFIRHGTNYPNFNESSAIRKLHQFRDRVIQNHEERRSMLIKIKPLEIKIKINFFCLLILFY